MYKERCIQLICLEEKLDADVFLICHNQHSNRAMIDRGMVEVLRDAMRFSKHHDKLALIIHTPGGDAEETIYICRFLREYYDQVDTYIVGDCYSGGTIIALSSDNIYMSKNGCLGPIDIMLHYQEKHPWTPELYGLVSSLKKASDEKKISPELFQMFKNQPAVLGRYFKNYFSYKNIVGEYVDKHCPDPEKAKVLWEFLAEINFSHGTPLTYKRCRELGLDVKCMPAEIEPIVSKLVRDANREFGGFVTKSPLCSFYEGAETDVIRKGKVPTGKKGKRGVSVSYIKNTEKLAIIENPHAGYAQEIEQIITIYSILPLAIEPIKVGWREEYNTRLVLPEDNELFEEHINCAVSLVLASTGVDSEIISKESYERVRKFIKASCYNEALEELKEEGTEVDELSSAEKSKLVVEYYINKMEKLKEEEYAENIDSVYDVLKKMYQEEENSDFDALSEEEKRAYFDKVIDQSIEEVVEEMQITEEEADELDEDDWLELAIIHLNENN